MPACPATPRPAASPGSTGRCPEGTDAVILELGANDVLRGFDPEGDARGARGHPDAAEGAQHRGAACAACWRRPISARLCRAFDAIYPELAEIIRRPLYPFFLDGVAADAKLNQADGMHPTAAGVDVIVKSILPKVEDFLARYPGNAVEKQAAITLAQGFPAVEAAMLRRVT